MGLYKTGSGTLIEYNNQEDDHYGHDNEAPFQIGAVVVIFWSIISCRFVHLQVQR